MPIALISSVLKPTFFNCFLALVILATDVPATLAAVALAESLIVPITLSCNAPSTTSTVAALIGSTANTPAALANVSATSSDTVPAAASTTELSGTLATSSAAIVEISKGLGCSASETSLIVATCSGDTAPTVAAFASLVA